jgi:hypothetical protein
MLTTCPFHSERYLSGLSHIGVVDKRESAPVPILRRPIPGSPLFDGLGPWPYMSVASSDDIPALTDAFADLVTLTVITQPGYFPSLARGDVVHLKQHFVFDPGLPFPALSRKTRDHLKRGQKRWVFGPVEDLDERMDMERLYDDLRKRRGLTGGFFDFRRIHFETLAECENAVFFRVGDSEATVGMTCGAIFEDRLQLIHIALSEAGLQNDASYVLMQGVLDFCQDQRLLLLMGGTPRHGGAGVERFKARWSNRREPVSLVQIINQPLAYAELCRTAGDTSFFPAYRRPY